MGRTSQNASRPIPFISLLTSIRLPLSVIPMVASSSPCSLKMSATFSMDARPGRRPAAMTRTRTLQRPPRQRPRHPPRRSLGIWVQTSPVAGLIESNTGAGLSSEELPSDQVAKRFDFAHHDSSKKE